MKFELYAREENEDDLSKTMHNSLKTLLKSSIVHFAGGSYEID